MLTWGQFESEVTRATGRNISRKSNPEQHDSIGAALNENLFIVAGPGSGKTTVMVLRVLKLILVDGVEPQSIILTTFTKKAAAEIRSRLLGWGDALRRSILANRAYAAHHARAHTLAFNAVRTGTLDSITQEVLTDFRPPGAGAPVTVEDFVASAVMLKEGLFPHGRFRNRDLLGRVATFSNGNAPRGIGELSKILVQLKDHLHHDAVDTKDLQKRHRDAGTKVMHETIVAYEAALNGRELDDYSSLESRFLDQLSRGALKEFTDEIRYVFVDEYQDTNYLQEQIHLALGRHAINNGGGVVVVGDDDQSLYWFRGATVDLFSNFESQFHTALLRKARRIYLLRNYRSTPQIVQHCNGFAQLDAGYQSVRVKGKPPIVPARTGPFVNYPILGMFRPTADVLARDLAAFIDSVTNGGFAVAGKNVEPIHTARHGGIGDIAFLASSPAELNSTGTSQRLPGLLRQELGNLPVPIQMFNPRGHPLTEVPEIQQLCGLMLECLDPGGAIQAPLKILGRAKQQLDAWRGRAARLLAIDPPPHRRRLSAFVAAWQARTPLGRGAWERDVPVARLAYNLVTWIPTLQHDVEGMVHLECIVRTIEQAGSIGSFDGHFVRDPRNPSLEAASVKELIQNVFVPLAMGAVDIDEDLLETLPANRLNVLSIHQAKGLEFPLVIVDVGSEFKTDHSKQRFKRFPEDGGRTAAIEDFLRPSSPLGAPTRSGRDRSFDDLYRKYFVAYSRPQDVLLLVGTDATRKRIQNAATGWDRDGTWVWQEGLPNLHHI